MSLSTATFLPSFHHHLPTPHRKSIPYHCQPVTCGPRDNRGPIQRGRTLSTESILAVQSLKRATTTATHHQILSRLLIPDLTSAFSELIRQDLPLLSLSILSILRSEPNYKLNLVLYSQLIKSLHKNNHLKELADLIDRLVQELSDCGGIGKEGGLRGPARLMKSLVMAESADGVRRVYEMMKKGGCAPDEYLFGFIVRGLRRLGDEEGAKMVERDFERWDVGGEWGEMMDVECVVKQKSESGPAGMKDKRDQKISTGETEN